MDHRFQIHLRGIIELLSNHLYSGPEVFVRELLQNGVDAIRARASLEPDYSGEIHIEVHAPAGKPPTLVFSDNGIGLTEEEIHRFLATIGESSKRADLWQKPMDFIGQFGIGLLSCFVVSDEIVVVTRSARAGGKVLEWRGRPDGTYSLRTTEGDINPGTSVYLTCKKGQESLFTEGRICQLTRHFGGLLPFPIRVSAGQRSQVINPNGAPWLQEYTDERERKATLLGFGREVFGMELLDAIPLRSKVGAVDGVAYVLPYSPNLAARRTHRVYLKYMLLSENADNLLPEWAFFVKAVVNANDLRPTASRESFYDDDQLEAARAALGGCLRDYLVRLARHQPEKLERLIALHHLAIKALAVQDDEFYQLFIDWLPFETTQGELALGAYRKQHGVIRYVPTVDQFRQIAHVATAQGLCLINGGYTYHAELLARYADFFPDAQVEVVDPASLAREFDDLTSDEQEQAEALLDATERALQPYRCKADVRKFQPRDLPALYSLDSEGRFLRSLEQSKEVADPLWSNVLGNLGRAERSGTPLGWLYLNWNNPLIRRLAGVDNTQLLRRLVQLLYLQALLLGHHPLSSKEMKLLNEGLLDLIGWSVGDKKS